MNQAKLCELLDRISYEKISESDQLQIIDQLDKWTEDSEGKLCTLLQIITYIGYSDLNRRIVEKFIIYPANPLAAALALDILCSEWGLVEDYLDQIKLLMKGTDWDEEMDVRVFALFKVGEYNYKTGLKECLDYLLKVTEDKNEPNSIRKTAYISILRTLGRNWNQINIVRLFEPIDELFDKNSLAEAYHLLKTN